MSTTQAAATQRDAWELLNRERKARRLVLLMIARGVTPARVNAELDEVAKHVTESIGPETRLLVTGFLIEIEDALKLRRAGRGLREVGR